MTQVTFRVRTEIQETLPQIITERSTDDGVWTEIARQVINMQELTIREALVVMGWTPPTGLELPALPADLRWIVMVLHLSQWIVVFQSDDEAKAREVAQNHLAHHYHVRLYRTLFVEDYYTAKVPLCPKEPA